MCESGGYYFETTAAIGYTVEHVGWTYASHKYLYSYEKCKAYRYK